LIVTTLAAIDFPNLGFGRHAGNRFHGNLHAFSGNGEDVHGTIVFDVNFRSQILQPSV